MTGPEHYREAERLLTTQVHATLAAAPQPWLRCVDQLHGTVDYQLNPAHVVYIERRKDGSMWAADVVGRSHRIASEDEAKAEALIGGQP